MKKRTILISVIAALHSILYAQSFERELTPEEKAYVLSKFCTEVKYNFVHYDKLKINWDSLCKARMQELTSTGTTEEFENGMRKLAAELHDGHTYFSGGNIGNPKDWIKPFPFETKRLGDKVFVTNVYSSELQKKGIVKGVELIKIDGKDIFEKAERDSRPYVAASTKQWEDYYTYGGFNLTKDKGSKVSKLTFRTPEGKTFEYEGNRCISWDIQYQQPTVFEYKVIKKNIGYLKIKNFQPRQFKTEEFDSIYAKILNTKALIIDIRDNGGGNSGNADYIIRHLSDKPVKRGKWNSPMYIATHASWKMPPESYYKESEDLIPVQDKQIYTKPTVLLVNAGTFSSAENFSAAYRNMGTGTIIGTPTGGSTGNPISIDLGFGMYCNICTRNETLADGTEFIGVGIIPDIHVEETEEMYTKGKDTVIEKALEVIAGK